MKNQLILLVSFFTLPFCLSAQNFDREKMDQLFDRLAESDRAMLTVSLFENGKEVYTRSVGYADMENNIKAEAHTQYRIGSVAKTYTAALVMQMVENGKISLESPLSDFFPEIPNAEKITIEMMLRHRSGIFNFTSDEDYANYLTKPHTRKELLTIIKQYPAVFEPGSQLQYSNSNYVLLSIILERISGKEYSQLLYDQITGPHQLKNTFIASSIDEYELHAHSYERKRAWERSIETHPSIPLGAGALTSTANDINHFFHLLFTHQIVGKSSLEKMTVPKDGSGLGIFQFPFYDKLSWGHTGGIDGFQAVGAFFPAEGFGISIVANAAATSLNDFLIGVLSIYFDKPYDLPVFQPFLFIEEEELLRYHGTYSHPQFPLKITIWNDEHALMAQATGQPAINLDARGNHVFAFDAARLTLTFNPDEKTMLLQQAGMEWLMTKEE